MGSRGAAVSGNSWLTRRLDAGGVLTRVRVALVKKPFMSTLAPDEVGLACVVARTACTHQATTRKRGDLVQLSPKFGSARTAKFCNLNSQP